MTTRFQARRTSCWWNWARACTNRLLALNDHSNAGRGQYELQCPRPHHGCRNHVIGGSIAVAWASTRTIKSLYPVLLSLRHARPIAEFIRFFVSALIRLIVGTGTISELCLANVSPLDISKARSGNVDCASPLPSRVVNAADMEGRQIRQRISSPPQGNFAARQRNSLARPLIPAMFPANVTRFQEP